MNEIHYFVYENGDMLAGFATLCTAVTFIEDWRSDSIPVDLIAANTGEVIDTYVNGAWQKAKF